METLIIKTQQKIDLSGFTRLLIHFNHYKKLFGGERKLYQKHFKKIEIEFPAIENNIQWHRPNNREAYS